MDNCPIVPYAFFVLGVSNLNEKTPKIIREKVQTWLQVLIIGIGKECCSYAEV